MAPLCVYIPTTFGIAYARVRLLHSRGSGSPICDLSRFIATRQLDAFTVLSTQYISNNCIYVRSHLFAGTNSIAVDLMTMKDWLFSVFFCFWTTLQISFIFGKIDGHDLMITWLDFGRFSSWPWPWIVKVRYGIRYISSKNGPIATKQKAKISIEL